MCVALLCFTWNLDLRQTFGDGSVLDRGADVKMILGLPSLVEAASFLL